MDQIILICIGVSLVLHRYLSIYWEVGTLPRRRSFELFAMVLHVLVACNSVWLLEWKAGIAFALLTTFQITYSSVLWPFLVPLNLQMIRENNEFNLLRTPRRVNPLLYLIWSWLIIGLAILTFANMAFGEYGSLWDCIMKRLRSVELLILIVSVTIVCGNLLRVFVVRYIKKRMLF